MISYALRYTVFSCIAMVCLLCVVQVGAEDYKQAILELEKSLTALSGQELSQAQLSLAKLYYKDQDHEKAFKIYLKSLSTVHSTSGSTDSAEALEFYTKALNTYLNQNILSVQESAVEIIKEYKPVLEKNPDYRQLGFIMAVSYANLNMFPEFFDLFYHSHQIYPEHFLSYKTRAILHMKIFERMLPGPEKERERQIVVDNLAMSSEKNPNDASLYRMMILLAPDENKRMTVLGSLNKILDKNIMVPRADIVFYVQQALALDEAELAQRFLNKTKDWYQYSRVINLAQELIDQNKQK